MRHHLRRHDDARNAHEIAERRRELLRAYVDSVPPPPELAEVVGRFEARFEPESSAIHDLRELQRLQRATDTNALAVRFEDERAGRLAAEAQLAKHSERLWLVLTGVLVLVIAAGVLWAITALVKADRTEVPHHADPTPTQTRLARTDRAV